MVGATFGRIEVTLAYILSLSKEYLKNTVVFNIVERSLEGKRDYLYDFLWLLATKYNKYSDYEPMVDSILLLNHFT